MQFVFLEGLKDAYRVNKEGGIVSVWVTTIIDALKSLTHEHLDQLQKGVFMKNKSIVRVIGGVALILLLLALGNAASGDWNWDETDFIVVGILLTLTGAALEFAMAKVKTFNQRVLAGFVILIVCMLIWAELAVGLFGTPFAGN